MSVVTRVISPIAPVTAGEIANFLNGRLVGTDCAVVSASPASQLGRGALSFSVGRKVVLASDAGAVVVVRTAAGNPDGNSYIEVENPRVAFARALTRFFRRPPMPGIAPSARIHGGAKIAASVSVGEGAVIEDDVSIADGTVIEQRVVIHAGTRIGRHCVVSAGAVIGCAGFGYVRDEDGIPRHIPHLGGVRIGDDVHVGPNSTIARGTVSDTIVGDHTKIGPQVNLQHNCVVGSSCIIAGQSQICGSVAIGKNCWIGSNSTIRQSVSVGDKAVIGLGVLIFEDVPAGASIFGQPGTSVAAGGAAPSTRPTDGRPDVAQSAPDAEFEAFVRQTLKLLPAFPISDALTPNDVPGWDSLGHVNLLVDAQARFGVVFGIEAMAEVRCIGDLRRLIRSDAESDRL